MRGLPARSYDHALVDTAPNDPLADETKLVGAPPTPAGEDVNIPESGRLGRFMVIDEAGSGGMGKVYRAYDPKLCREVALKVLRQKASDEAGRVRMLREAQGMARISHPNVLPVYDVEPHGDVLFIVLEYVEGQTLYDFVDKQRPDWRRVIELYVEAGRGLHAAHEMDIVHRDFKPGNVLVGDDGRVRVMDFGLARTASGDALGEGALESSATDDLSVDETDPSLFTGEQPLLSSHVTRLGMTMGTPAYMAPEQHAGAPLDARCDQFSFCIALYESLYGQRPYKGSHPQRLSRAKRKGRIEPPPGDRYVPRWVHQIILRGLSPQQVDRWPSMAALVERLEAGLRPPTMRRAWGVVGLAGLLAGGAYALADRDEDPCDIESRLDGTWDQERSAKISAAFADTGLSYASASWERVRAGIDEYLQAWVSRRTEVCEHGLHNPNSGRTALQEACLDTRLAEARALLDIFEGADADVVEQSVAAMSALRPIEPCMDDRALALALPDPDAGQRETVESLTANVHRVRALGKAGKYPEALELGESVRLEAIEADYLPLIAELDLLTGRFLDRLGRMDEAENRLSDSYFGALASSHGTVAYDAATALAGLVGSGQARGTEGLAWSRHARAQLAALPEGAADPSHIETAVGNIHREMGDVPKALAHFEIALGIVERDRSPNHPDVAAAITNLGTAHALEARYDLAIDYLRRALAVRRAALGNEHPDVGGTLNNLGFTYDTRGDWKEAEQAYLEAGRVFEAAFGPDHDTAGRISMNLAVVYHRQNQFERAEEKYEAALENYLKFYGPDHPRPAGVRLNLGTLYMSMDLEKEAIEVITAALESFRLTLGDEHPSVADALGNLAEAYRAAGDLDRARKLAREALDLREKLLGADHPDLAYSHSTLAGLAAEKQDWLTARSHDEHALRIRLSHLPHDHPNILTSAAALGKMHLELGENSDAITMLEERLKPAINSEPSTPRGELQFVLAQALDTDPKRKSEAPELARAALADLQKTAPNSGMVAEVRAWISKH